MDCGRKVSEMIQNFITSFMRYSSFWRFLNAYINLFYFFFVYFGIQILKKKF